MSKKVWPEMSKDSHLEPNTDLQDLKLFISRIWVSFESKHEPVKSPILNVNFIKFTPNPTHLRFLEISSNFRKFQKISESDLSSVWVWQKTILSSKIPNECSKAKNSYHRPENVFLDFYKCPFPAEYSLIHVTNNPLFFLAQSVMFFRLTIRPVWRNRTGRRWCA